MLFSVDLTTSKLEALIMTTRDEMLAALTELSNKVVDEAAQSKATIAAMTEQSKTIVASMTEVVTGLKDKVAAFEAADAIKADFSVESAKIAEIEASIGAIIEPPVETVVPPVEVPVEPPVETTVVPPVEVAGFPPIDPIVPPVVMPVV